MKMVQRTSFISSLVDDRYWCENIFRTWQRGREKEWDTPLLCQSNWIESEWNGILLRYVGNLINFTSIVPIFFLNVLSSFHPPFPASLSLSFSPLRSSHKTKIEIQKFEAWIFTISRSRNLTKGKHNNDDVWKEEQHRKQHQI